MFRTYSNSTIVNINTKHNSWYETGQLLDNISSWAEETLVGEIEIHPNRQFSKLTILCELEEDAILVALKWKK